MSRVVDFLLQLVTLTLLPVECCLLRLELRLKTRKAHGVGALSAFAAQEPAEQCAKRTGTSQ